MITGSANINQRSLDGDRDSELAIGAYQPKHLCTNYRDTSPKGEVHKFRKSLFEEHLGKLQLSNMKTPLSWNFEKLYVSECP